MASSKPRGARLNNPGNLRHGQPWQGLADVQTDPEFCQFVSPAWGFRAMAVLLLGYQDRSGIKTIKDAITRWAPPSENNTAAYIDAVCKNSGFGATDVLDFHSYNDAYPVLRSITIQEQGSFEGLFSKSQLDVGCIKAGLENAPRGIASTVVKGIAGVGGAAAAAAASDPGSVLATYNTVKPIVDVAPELVKHLFWGLAVCAFAGIGIGEFVRIKNRKG